jgi:hypothetical protein
MTVGDAGGRAAVPVESARLPRRRSAPASEHRAECFQNRGSLQYVGSAAVRELGQW